MNLLNIIKYKITLRFTKDTYLLPFVGNTIRGAFGRALSEVCNIGGGGDTGGSDKEGVGCAGSSAKSGAVGSNGDGSNIDNNADSSADTNESHNECSDAYSNVFKVSSDASVPNPYAISAPYPSKGKYTAGDELSFNITLFGNAASYTPEILTAAACMCRGKFQNAICHNRSLVYDTEWSDNGADSIPHCDTLIVQFLSPTEILNNKEPVTELSFSAFIDSLFGRIGGIIDNYTDSQFIIPYSLIADKPFVRAEYDLKSINLETNSQPIQSFIGTIRYYGDVTRYLPYIDLGSQLHICKKTTRSCGEYTYEI